MLATLLLFFFAADARFLGEIEKIPAIDNHAHPVCPTATKPNDRDFDALPVDNLEPESTPFPMRPTNPNLALAKKALFGTAGKAAIQKQQGSHYANWVLDQMHIEAMLANRVTLCKGIAPPRFRWVPYADALLFPLDNSKAAGDNPDRKVYFPLEDRLLKRYLADSGLQETPTTLDEYLAQVVTPTLERQRQAGAVAEKFEVAYLRKLDFGNPAKSQAAAVYKLWRKASAGAPTAEDYKTLQDYLFRYIASECGRLGMAVHLHAMAGDGGYFDVAGVNPLLMEPLLNDPALRKTKFVFLHGGWPYIREITALLEKPNVYLDFSSQVLTIMPATLAQTLREWLERNPEKILFGSDAYPYSEAMGWEESLWIANRQGRMALAMALEGMERDHEISHVEGLRLAHLVLHDNARDLYGGW